MKNNKKQQHQQRQILDQKIATLSAKPRPKNGWIKSIRNSLGISTRQLAELMKVSLTSVSQLEAGELKQSISLKKLEQAAEAMDCELVYMFVPKSDYQSLDDLLEKKSLALAAKISAGVSHSMTLEQQGVSDKITQTQVKHLAQELKQNLDSRMWAPSTKPKVKK